jgi:hypothetical protein
MCHAEAAVPRHEWHRARSISLRLLAHNGREIPRRWLGMTDALYSWPHAMCHAEAAGRSISLRLSAHHGREIPSLRGMTGP